MERFLIRVYYTISVLLATFLTIVTFPGIIYLLPFASFGLYRYCRFKYSYECRDDREKYKTYFRYIYGLHDGPPTGGPYWNHHPNYPNPPRKLIIFQVWWLLMCFLIL